MTQELLLEIGTEELPAGYIQPALNHLKQKLTKFLQDSNLAFGEITTFATPRQAPGRPIQRSYGSPKTGRF